MLGGSALVQQAPLLDRFARHAFTFNQDDPPSAKVDVARVRLFRFLYELWPKVGDRDARKAAYRGRWKPA
jgi:hypothetical protein